MLDTVSHKDTKRSKPDQIIQLPSSSPVKLAPSLTRAPSPSSSEYSCESDTAPSSRTRTRTRTKGKTLKHSRPTTALSDVGTDRRRLAIVQMEPPNAYRSKSASGDGRDPRPRGVATPNLAGLSIVAPPDASLSTYAHLSPPVSAEGAGETTSTPKRTGPRPGLRTAHKSSSQHSLLMSGSHRNEQHDTASIQQHDTASIQLLAQRSSANSSSVNLHSPSSVDRPLVTPPIGEGKDIHTPVAGPVVVNLDSSRPLNIVKAKTMANDTPNTQSSADSTGKRSDVPYIQYKPGLHATAGPLPPPPRAAFAIDPNGPPPPRPPRMATPHPPRCRGDIEAVKQALQLPPSVAAVLASRSPTSSSEPSSASSPSPKIQSPKSFSPESLTSLEDVTEVTETKPSHHREGAFVPTPDLANEQKILSYIAPQEPDQKRVATTASVELNSCEELQGLDAVAADDSGGVVIAPPPRIDSLSVTFGDDKTPSHVHQDPTPEISIDRPPSPDTTHIPSPPPKSFRNSLTTSLKRFSALPRPPSASSKSGNRSSVGTIRTSRTPSPPYASHQQAVAQPQRPKVITKHPPSLFCHEVHSIKSASERCSIYARKINELYNCDTGLAVWLYAPRHRGTNNASSALSEAPPSPSTDQFTPQRRHASGSSMKTEASFPRRPDATTATDLTNIHRDITLPFVQPPPLPYPSLAMPQHRPPPRSSTIANNTSSSSIRSLAPSAPTSALKSSFFASLGRRTSISGRREKPGITALSPTNSQKDGVKMSNVVVTPQPSPRPVNVTASPSVPGGPRALPSRIKRSQTLMVTPAPFSMKPEAQRSPTQNTDSDHIIDRKPNPEFTRQVDKLADLLPHADRDILAAYLRRTGQDILAIGQYLEDEKNGTIHTD